MKRRIALLCTLLMLVSLVCAPLIASAASFSASKADMRVKGGTYRLGSTSTKWKDKLGAYTVKKYDGCTAGTDAYMYTFKSKGVKVETLQKRGSSKEEIITIILSKKSIGTSLGLKVGNNLKKMELKYGTDYEKSGTTCTYTAGKVSMVVRYNNKGAIKSITMMKDCG